MWVNIDEKGESSAISFPSYLAPKASVCLLPCISHFLPHNLDFDPWHFWLLPACPAILLAPFTFLDLFLWTGQQVPTYLFCPFLHYCDGLRKRPILSQWHLISLSTFSLLNIILDISWGKRTRRSWRTSLRQCDAKLCFYCIILLKTNTLGEQQSFSSLCQSRHLKLTWLVFWEDLYSCTQINLGMTVEMTSNSFINLKCETE